MIERVTIKLKSKRAETLLETLISLLIAVLSVTLLTSAVTAAARINKTTKEADILFKEELAEAETASVESAVQNPVKITFDNAAGFTNPIVSITVKVYGTGDYASYQKEEVTP